MQQQDLCAWLALSFTPKLTQKMMARLLSLDALANMLGYSSQQWLALGLKPEQVEYLIHHAQREVDACLEWQVKDPERHIITLYDDQNYPPLLREVASPPKVLFVEGQCSMLAQPQIAIVGSRNATIDSRNIAQRFAAQLVAHDLTITSGLALGIDGYAHDGALQASGTTIAVLGSGLECIYPARHRSLAERIKASGALVSEFRPGTKPRAEHFPRRNRIISGLALGVLVVEAAEKSGSLITARYALEQGREVFVVPGPIHIANCQGSNRLIQQGACLVQSVDDILAEITTFTHWAQKSPIFPQGDLFSSSNGQEELPFPELLANVGIEATPVDILAQRTHIPVQEVMMQLLELELLGQVVAVSGGYIRKGRGKL
ncbi:MULTISPECIES: DNA-processing protein DprA [unclassified Vibrio]|uniref:DNA-processing protein DprA n=1 Tax=unclassified Vibrio TaxID=2614977 RepID=UPI0014823FF2|nr:MULTISPECIES: DNA-processing protein DprA [unclassified Vibrio]NNN46143.1 DNA-protecting protein DprA [Vibrio sp. 1-1(7)]NNN74043.1 DNA-protecting protein DprA [Vibrio sp. 12-2(3-a)]